MHLGIMAKTFPRPNLEATLDAIADRGITHVQFNLSCAGLPTLPDRPDEDRCARISRSLRERGLTMAAISGTFNLCDPDQSRLEENLHRLGGLASVCRWLDTRIITLCTGTRHPEDMWRWHPENVRRSTWDALVRSVRSAVDVADRYEITLAFEPERHNVVNSVARARMLLDKIGSPWLKVVIDPANLMGPEDFAHLAEILDEAFDWLGRDIVLAHAKNPPYVSLRADIEAAQQYLERNEPKVLSTGFWKRYLLKSRLEKAAHVPEDERQFLGVPVPPSLLVLQDYYVPYVRRLKQANYSGALVLHGLAEDEVGLVQHVTSELIRGLRTDY